MVYFEGATLNHKMCKLSSGYCRDGGGGVPGGEEVVQSDGGRWSGL